MNLKFDNDKYCLKSNLGLMNKVLIVEDIKVYHFTPLNDAKMEMNKVATVTEGREAIKCARQIQI